MGGHQIWKYNLLKIVFPLKWSWPMVLLYSSSAYYSTVILCRTSDVVSAYHLPQVHLHQILSSSDVVSTIEVQFAKFCLTISFSLKRNTGKFCFTYENKVHHSLGFIVQVYNTRLSFYVALLILCQLIIFHEYIYTKSITVYCCGGIKCQLVLLFSIKISLLWWLELVKQDGSSRETDVIPTPIVIIDQDSDPDATIVEITFGDRLGALLDTVWHIHFRVLNN